MWFDKIEKYNYPKWLIWVCWEVVAMVEMKTWWIMFECERTWLGVLCFADKVNNITWIRCLSLWDDWECVNWKCPNDENWNRICNIQRQINK